MEDLVVENIKAVFEDERGQIFDILDHEEISHVGFISSVKGCVRGNHYHKTAKQINYITKGKIELLTRDANNEDAEVKKFILNEGDMISVPAFTVHTMTAIEDSEFWIFTDKPRSDGGYEDDTHRVEIKK